MIFNVMRRWWFQIPVLAVLLWLLFILTGRALCKIAIAQIAELTNTKIKTQSVVFSLDGSVRIKRLVIDPVLPSEHDRTILKAETVYARFSLGSLLLLQPRLKEISVNDFIFDAVHDLDWDRWNIASLRISAPSGTSGRMPLIRLEKGKLQYSKISHGQVKIAAAVPLDARFGFDEETQDGYSFDITTAAIAEGFGKSKLTGFWKPGRVTITGGISSTDIPAFEKAWTIEVLAAELNYDQNAGYSLRLRIKQLFSRQKSAIEVAAFERPQFLKKFGAFTALEKFLSRYRPWGSIDIDLDATGSLEQLSESSLAGKVYCKDVLICDRKFPYLVEHISGEIDFTEKSVLLNNLQGRHGQTGLFFNGWVRNFGPNQQYQVRVTSDNMVLDADLYNSLDPQQKKFWSFFSPRGLVKIDQCFSKTAGADKKNTLAVELLGIEAACSYFPYSLNNLAGALLFEPDDITVTNLVSQSDDRIITLNGRITDCSTDKPQYDILVKARNIPLDSKLISAMSDKQKNFFRQFEMTGLADADVKVFTPVEKSDPFDFVADVNFNRASLKISRTSLVISGISGKAVCTPELIDIKDFTGSYRAGRVSLTGQVHLTEQPELLNYQLRLRAEQVELNNDLFALLPPQMEKVAAVLQPKGMINYNINLTKTDSNDSPDYKTTVDCLGGSIVFEQFPYPLKDISGRLTITKDAILLENLGATAADSMPAAPNTPAIKINGRLDLADNAFKSGRFAICANDICFDERLGDALPEDIRRFYFNLSPAGFFDLDLPELKVSDAGTGEKYVDFAGEVRFKSRDFDTSAAVTQLDGILKTQGLYKTGDGFHEGSANLAAERLKVKGKSLTRVKADINYDSRLQNWSTENLTADSYGGRLTAKITLSQPARGPPVYQLQGGFSSLDLEKLFRHADAAENHPHPHTSGKVCGSVSITGRIGDNSSPTGRCTVTITDMKVGRLSPLAKLLQLKLDNSEYYVFDRMFVDSYIKPDGLFFDKVDLSGQDTAFNGSGRLELPGRNLDLTLTARGRRAAAAEPDLWQSLAEVLGRAVVRMEITGDFYDPNVITTPLPVIKDALGILGTKPASSD
jgi:hypothetical protein